MPWFGYSACYGGSETVVLPIIWCRLGILCNMCRICHNSSFIPRSVNTLTGGVVHSVVLRPLINTNSYFKRQGLRVDSFRHSGTIYYIRQGQLLTCTVPEAKASSVSITSQTTVCTVKVLRAQRELLIFYIYFRQ